MMSPNLLYLFLALFWSPENAHAEKRNLTCYRCDSGNPGGTVDKICEDAPTIKFTFPSTGTDDPYCTAILKKLTPGSTPEFSITRYWGSNKTVKNECKKSTPPANPTLSCTCSTNDCNFESIYDLKMRFNRRSSSRRTQHSSVLVLLLPMAVLSPFLHVYCPL